MYTFRRIIGLGAASLVAALVPIGAAGAVLTPTTGQPGTTAGFKNCGTNTAPAEPGNAASAPGSAFNETTPGHAGTVYAGNGSGSTQHAGSTAAVSQYDAACRQLSSPHSPHVTEDHGTAFPTFRRCQSGGGVISLTYRSIVFPPGSDT